jgi:hypothetical protein
MVRDRAAQNESNLGIGRVNYPLVGDEGDGEKLNDFK